MARMSAISYAAVEARYELATGLTHSHPPEDLSE
jgi:hypothetical protein